MTDITHGRGMLMMLQYNVSRRKTKIISTVPKISTAATVSTTPWLFGLSPWKIVIVHHFSLRFGVSDEQPRGVVGDKTYNINFCRRRLVRACTRRWRDVGVYRLEAVGQPRWRKWKRECAQFGHNTRRQLISDSKSRTLTEPNGHWPKSMKTSNQVSVP